MDSPQGESKTALERAAKIISFLTISPFQIIMYMSFAEIICNDFWEAALLNTCSGIFYLVIPLIPLLYVSSKYKIRNYSIPLKDRMPLFYIQIVGFL